MRGNSGWTASALLNSFSNVQVYSSAGRRAVHKPLLILLAIADVTKGGSGRFSFNEVEPVLAALINEFGNTAIDGSAPRAHYPFWYLKNDGFWSFRDYEGLTPRTGKGKGGEPSISVLRAVNAEAGLVQDVALLLASDPVLRTQAINQLLDASFPETRRQDVLDAIGIELEAPAPAKREAAFRQSVLLEYGYRCAICGFDGRIGPTSVGIEAAHIKMFSFGGTNNVTNGIALCSLHHKLFDAGALTIEAESLEVRISSRFSGLSSGVGLLIQSARTRVKHLPLRTSSSPGYESLKWHNSQIFMN
jgi:putative restriction endonuclease